MAKVRVANITSHRASMSVRVASGGALINVSVPLDLLNGSREGIEQALAALAAKAEERGASARAVASLGGTQR